jgi:hypothetical protein
MLHSSASFLTGESASITFASQKAPGSTGGGRGRSVTPRSCRRLGLFLRLLLPRPPKFASHSTALWGRVRGGGTHRLPLATRGGERELLTQSREGVNRGAGAPPCPARRPTFAWRSAPRSFWPASARGAAGPRRLGQLSCAPCAARPHSAADPRRSGSRIARGNRSLRRARCLQQGPDAGTSC